MQVRFQKYGVWSLLFSWLPLGGDILTCVAGVMRVPFLVFLPLVAMGKALRYIAVFYLSLVPLS
jgi:membrane protein YqaA with SNARE-associated domain